MANTCFSLKAGAVDLGLAWVRPGFNHRRGLFGLVFMRKNICDGDKMLIDMTS